MSDPNFLSVAWWHFFPTSYHLWVIWGQKKGIELWSFTDHAGLQTETNVDKRFLDHNAAMHHHHVGLYRSKNGGEYCGTGGLLWGYWLFGSGWVQKPSALWTSTGEATWDWMILGISTNTIFTVDFFAQFFWYTLYALFEISFDLTSSSLQLDIN
jgi:hypothetical protein